MVQFPNRYKLTPVSGDIYDLTPEPGIVTEPGTDLNKANLLKDTTAALYGLGADAVPNDVFEVIPPSLDQVGDIKTTVRTDLVYDWLMCNGDAVSKESYPDLYALLGVSGAWTANSQGSTTREV